VGGAPRNVRVLAKHPWGLPSVRHKTRVNAYDAGRSPLGAPPWRLSPPLIPAQAGIQVLGPRFRGDERKRLTPLPAPPSGSSPETPLNERGCERSSMNSIRSQ